MYENFHMHMYVCVLSYPCFDRHSVHFDNANICPRCVCVCMLTDLLSFWVLLIRIYTHIYMYEETKTIRLIRLHLDLLCVRMSSLLLMYNRGSYQTYIYINIKETHLTL
jgi:hypothetical protein